MKLPKNSSEIPLIVDLDGSLLKTDMLIESMNLYAIKWPQKIFALLFWIFKSLVFGKDHLKVWLVRHVSPPISSLPFNEHVLEWLRTEKQAGRTLVLATATHQDLAQKVADHFGIFDQVIGTCPGINLKSIQKRDVLIGYFGVGGFDYVGNEDADLPIWEVANVAHVVTNSTNLVSRLKTTCSIGKVFSTGQPCTAIAVVNALRLHQWAKNALVFVPLLAAHVYDQQVLIAKALFAFLVFGMAASSVYLLNDLVDVQDDRHHLRKKARPFANGDLNLIYGWLLWPALMVGSFMVAWYFLSVEFSTTLLFYALLTTAYSFYLKRLIMLDVLTLAGLYTLRIVAGAFAINVPISFWLLLFSMFIFLSLALIKRYSELKIARDNGRTHSLRGRGYTQDDLEIVASLGGSSGFIAVLVLALYIQDTHTAALYETPQLIWVLCPILLYWISRAWLIAHRGQMHDDPIVFALRDWVSWLIVTIMAVTLVFARMH